MKKWFKGLAALALAINMMPALSIKAEEELNLDGESAVLIDADSGAVLYEKNADDRHYPAKNHDGLSCLKPGQSRSDADGDRYGD